MIRDKVFGMGFDNIKSVIFIVNIYGQRNIKGSKNARAMEEYFEILDGACWSVCIYHNCNFIHER